MSAAGSEYGSLSLIQLGQVILKHSEPVALGHLVKDRSESAGPRGFAYPPSLRVSDEPDSIAPDQAKGKPAISHGGRIRLACKIHAETDGDPSLFSSIF